MNTNKRTWICDTCGHKIEKVEHGWVEWLTDQGTGQRMSRGLRLVHHNSHSPRLPGSKCSYNSDKEYTRSGSILGDGHLSEFLGPDGLKALLLFLHYKEFADDEEVLQLIKRLHLPSYEHAFRHIPSAIEEGVIESECNSNFYPSQSQLEKVINWAKDRSLNQ